jgi:integrase
MRAPIDAIPRASCHEPWNKGKFIGAKPPLRRKQVWSIRAKLQVSGRTRDLAMFNLAINSKLRGCDVVSLKVENIAPHGHAAERATIRQKKTGQPVRFEMTEQTREAVDSYITAANKKPGLERAGDAVLVKIVGRRDITRQDPRIAPQSRKDC